MERNYAHLVGIPYKKLNCYELVKKFYADVLKKELKSYYDVAPSDRVEMQNLVYTSKGDFVRVDTPEFGDIVLIKIEGLESHIAVYVGNGFILHTLVTTQASVVQRINPRWRHVVSGYYRLRENND